ncbi:MAG: protoheme IX farnesyltransferase [Dehalococcoidia bacterium]|nr:protoheme IX farnesyltransferase [Dehalococcoidia bacterium]
MQTATQPAVGVRPLEVVRGYVALTKPTIIVLLLITTIPAMVLASGGWPDVRLVLATLLGGFLSAGGAAAINQFADRDIDGMMQRTRHRPIPSGIVPPIHALWFGIALGIASVLWLAWQVNFVSAALAAAAIAMYAGVYTYGLKRTTVQNIVIGGAAGAAPPVIGWAAVTGTVSVEALLLFLIVFYWTPPHFWALSLRLEEDYRAAGVPMGPVVWGEMETKRQIVLYTVLLVAVTIAFGAVAQLSWLYFGTAIIGGVWFIALAARLLRQHGRDQALPLFFFSMVYLAALFASMMADELLLG